MNATNGATSMAANGEADRKPEHREPIRVVDGVRIPHGATHWRCKRLLEELDGSGQRKGVDLSWRRDGGVLEETEWPVEDFSARAIQARWGEGWYRATWRGVDPMGVETPKTFGRSTDLKIAPVETRVVEQPAPAPAPAPVVVRCAQCASALVAGARFCAQCGLALGAAPAPAPPAPPVQSSQIDLFLLGQTNAMKLFESITAQVVAKEQASTERYKADLDAKLERERRDYEEKVARERREHEMRLKEHTAALDRAEKLARPDDAVVRAIVERLEPRFASIEEQLAGDDDDDDEEEPETTETVHAEPVERTSETAKAVEDWVDVGRKAAETATKIGEAAVKVGEAAAPIVGAIAEKFASKASGSGTPSGGS